MKKNSLKLNNDDIIFIAGGGWMGEDYEDELVIEDIIKRFNNNLIVILPQTIHISENNNTCINRMSKIYNSSDKVIITVREENSLRVCKNLLKIPDNRLFLLPDMGLLHKFEEPSNVKSGVALFSIRDDVEKLDQGQVDIIKTYLLNREQIIRETSTVVHTKSKVIPISKRTTFLNTKIKEFRDADVVVTDRLHSMILSIVSGTKCIAFDNATHNLL